MFDVLQTVCVQLMSISLTVSLQNGRKHIIGLKSLDNKNVYFVNIKHFHTSILEISF